MYHRKGNPNLDKNHFHVQKVESHKEVLEILLAFDDSFEPKLSHRVESMDSYSKKIHNHAVTYSMIHNHESVGFVSFYPNETELFIALIAIKSHKRRCKIGTRLLNVVLEYCHKNAIHQIRLEVDDSNKNAVSFYCKHGFEPEKKIKKDTTYYKRTLYEHTSDNVTVNGELLWENGN